jgi:hypothetical protein
VSQKGIKRRENSKNHSVASRELSRIHSSSVLLKIYEFKGRVFLRRLGFLCCHWDLEHVDGVYITDLKKANIGHKNALGQVVHFHSFRKTFQTLGVNYGINQRSAQEFLGHSDANLTARAYTDVPAIGLHAEMAKLPWISTEKPDAPLDAQVSGNPRPQESLAGIISQLSELLKATGTEGLSRAAASPGIPGQIIEMAARAGIEPATK